MGLRIEDLGLGISFWIFNQDNLDTSIPFRWGPCRVLYRGLYRGAL